MAWYMFENGQQQVAALKSVICDALAVAIVGKGKASWAVSGGSTPTPLFKAMQTCPLEWPLVQIALVDERWVGVDHPRSNEAFVKQTLCQDLASTARFVGMKTLHENPQAAETEVNKRYAGLSLPFDSVLLGMGPDGHTASLFPDAEGLAAAMDPAQSKTCVALTAHKSEVTGDEVQRMSLSAHAIAAARQVLLMITGDEKRRLLEQALKTGSELPVARLMRQCAIDIYWAP